MVDTILVSWAFHSPLRDGSLVSLVIAMSESWDGDVVERYFGVLLDRDKSCFCLLLRMRLLVVLANMMGEIMQLLLC